eukprot:s1127_g23.t1
MISQTCTDYHFSFATLWDWARSCKLALEFTYLVVKPFGHLSTVMALQKQRQRMDLVPSQVAPAVMDDASLQLASSCAQGMSEQDLYNQLSASGTSQMEVWRNTVHPIS